MNTIEINQENLLKAYANGSKDNQKLLKSLFPDQNFNIKITDRCKTFDDACRILNLVHPFQPVGLEDIVLGKDLKAVTAFIKLNIISRVLNEGWEPNWNDDNEKKWYPWFRMAGGFAFYVSYYDYTGTFTFLGSRLCYRSKEISDYAGTQFLPEYKDLMVL